MMFNNVGTIDRILRLAAGVILLYLGLNVYDGSSLGVGLDALGVIATFSGIFGACPLYGLLRINTRRLR
jgi:hypothetical protein